MDHAEGHNRDLWVSAGQAAKITGYSVSYLLRLAKKYEQEGQGHRLRTQRRADRGHVRYFLPDLLALSGRSGTQAVAVVWEEEQRLHDALVMGYARGAQLEICCSFILPRQRLEALRAIRQTGLVLVPWSALLGPPALLQALAAFGVVIREVDPQGPPRDFLAQLVYEEIDEVARQVQGVSADSASRLAAAAARAVQDILEENRSITPRLDAGGLWGQLHKPD